MDALERLCHAQVGGAYGTPVPWVPCVCVRVYSCARARASEGLTAGRAA